MTPPLFPRRVIAAMMIVYFGDLAIRAHVYSSGTVDTARQVMPLAWWGTALFLCGMAMALTTGRRAVYIAATVMAAWCGALAAAVIEGRSQAPAGTVWLIGVVVLLIWSTGRPDYAL